MSQPTTILVLLKRVDCNDGVASYCETLIKGLKARGDRVVIVSGPVTQLYGSTTRHSAIRNAVLDWVVLGNLKASQLTPRVIQSIIAVIRTHNVDVISPQGLSMLPLAFVLSKLCHRPVVANYHPSVVSSMMDGIATTHSVKAKLGYWLITNLFTPNRFIANSRAIEQFFLTDCGIASGKVEYIVNGIDTRLYREPTGDERQQARKALAIPENSFVCVLAGRLNFVKGHDVAIDAVRLIRKTHPKINVISIFAGSGDQASEIQSYALKDEADRATFRFTTGYISSESLRNIYWASDVAVLPSRFEGFALTIAEAMSCGCVPIRTPSGGWHDQVIEGVTGFIIPFNDPAALAARIIDLADPLRRDIMRTNAIAHALQNFPAEKMVVATAALYHSLANK